ncbi:vacuolar protein sorting-associated protein 52 A-like isoform X5 [Miscanthus floridulus]
MDMGLKLKNRKAAESKLSKFVEDIIVPPRMIDIIVDGEVNDEYMKTLETLSKKFKFIDADPMVKSSKALKDVQPEVERLRQKAVSKIFEFVIQKFYALRKPKTNIQILQQSVLLKYKYTIIFLKEHAKEIYAEVRAAYIDTMNKVLSAHFRAYIQALEKPQMDIATSTDLLGVETRSTGFIFSIGKEPLKTRPSVFALGERINILKVNNPAPSVSKSGKPFNLRPISPTSPIGYNAPTLAALTHQKIRTKTITSKSKLATSRATPSAAATTLVKAFKGVRAATGSSSAIPPISSTTPSEQQLGTSANVPDAQASQPTSVDAPQPIIADVQAKRKASTDTEAQPKRQRSMPIPASAPMSSVIIPQEPTTDEVTEDIPSASSADPHDILQVASSSQAQEIALKQEIDQPALIPHIAEAKSHKYSYEVLFRNFLLILPLQNTCLLMIFLAKNPYSMIYLQLIMFKRRIPCLDSYLDKVNMSLWPCFKMVFDLHLNSLRNANIKTLWEDDVHPHYVTRRYAEFTASLAHLNVEHGDGQLDLNLERLRMAIEDLLVKLAKMFAKPKLQTIFLINNYDLTISILKEAGTEGGKAQQHFEEVLKSNIAIYVEELLLEQFSGLIKFVKSRPADETATNSEKASIAEVEPLVKDFASRYKAAIELMHYDVITSFSNFLCGMEILRATLAQLLLYYTRLTECVKRINGGSALNKDLVSISSILFEIKKYSRTF